MLVAQDFHYALAIRADNQEDATARWSIALRPLVDRIVGAPKPTLPRPQA